MAIALRGKATNTVDNNTSLAVTISGIGIQNGDGMIAVVTTRPNSSTITPPGGWTLISSVNAGFPGIRQSVYKRVASSEPSSYTWSFSTANDIAIAIIVYSGTDQTDPVDVTNTATGNSSSPQAPSINTTVDNCQLLCTFTSQTGSAITHPSGMTEQWDIGTGDNDHQSEGADLALGAAGATGAKTATAASDNWVARAIALKPGAVTAKAPPPFQRHTNRVWNRRF